MGLYSFMLNLKPQSNAFEVNQLSGPDITNSQIKLFVKLMSQVDSISCRSFCQSLPIIPKPVRDDEALPDAQVIILIIDCISTSLFAKPIRQRTATQQRLIRKDEPNTDIVKFDATSIKSGIVRYSHCWKVSITLLQTSSLSNSRHQSSHCLMLSSTWLKLVKVPLGDNIL